MRNLKTTITGVMCCIGGVVIGIIGLVQLVHGSKDEGMKMLGFAGGIITAGVGLLNAKDA